MGLFFLYSLKVAICLIAFYLVYKLLLSKETFHAFNRVVLLSVVLISVIIPLLKVSTVKPISITEGFVSFQSLIVSTEVIDNESASTLSLMQVLFIIYMIGILVFFLREVVSLVRLLRIVSRSTAIDEHQTALSGIELDGAHLVVMKKDISPFSWFRYIVISENDWRTNPREILAHELAHIRLGHSWDVTVCNLLIVFQWWNPASWLLKREMQNVHEYEADEAVIKRGVDAKQYQMLLIKKSVGERLFSMANNLNQHSLKKRIAMMTTKKSNPWQKAKTLIALPMAALAVVAFANPEVERVAGQVETESEEMVSKLVSDMNTSFSSGEKSVEEVALVNHTPVKSITVKGHVTRDDTDIPVAGATVVLRGTRSSATTDREGKFQLSDVPIGAWIDVFMVNHEPASLQVTEQNASKLHFSVALKYSSAKDDADGIVFDVVENMPSFPGGFAVMMEWLSKNIKYPKDAFDAKQEGRVIAQFVVEKDGSVSNIHIIRSIYPSLDAEAIRVLKTMPKWNPGKQNGQNVRVKYALPVHFRLTGHEGNEKKIGSTDDSDDLVQAYKEAKGEMASLKAKYMIIVLDGKEVPENEIDEYLSLSPNRIESISIIKDVDKMKAKYGSRAEGKKGVMEIKLKK